MHGKETYKYLQGVTFAYKNKNWFKLNRYITYLITGCEPINSTLCRRRLSESGTCPTEHIIFDCEAYGEIRYLGIESYRNSRKRLIENNEMLAKFNELAKEIFSLRNGKRRGESRESAFAWQRR